MKPFFYLIYCLCFITLISCKRASQKEQEKQPTLSFEYNRYKNTHYTKEDSSLLVLKWDIQYQIPVLETTKKKDTSLKALFLDLNFANILSDFAIDIPDKINQVKIKALLDSLFLDTYQAIEKDYWKNRLKAPKNRLAQEAPQYEWSQKDSIYFEDSQLISYQITTYNYSGGAHGNTLIDLYNIDYKQKKMLHQEDLFIPNFEEQLKQMLINKLLLKNKAKDLDELSELGYIFTEGIKANDNFTISSKGITFFFNEYEIACFSAGNIKVFLPYNELAHLINKESPIYYLLTN